MAGSGLAIYSQVTRRVTEMLTACDLRVICG